MTRVGKAILNSRPVRLLFDIAKRIKLPGPDNLSLYEIGWFFVRELNTQIFDRCAAVTYNFVMAIPPTLLVLFSLVPYLPLDGVQDAILDALKLVAHNEKMYDSISTVILDFMNNERGGVLSSGILLTLLFSSNGIMALLRSFERRHLSVYVERHWLYERWKAVQLTVLLLVVALLSIVVIIIQTRVVDEILLNIFNNVIVIKIVSLLVVVLIIFTAIAIIYRFGPSLSQRVKFVSPGAIVATILSVLTSAGFFFMVDNFIHYNKVYGSIGTLMAFMVWIWLNTLVILIGYDLNLSVVLVKESREEENAEA
ncbi:MAG: YihY/virulence factor BrkB family protein [Chitinophagales bacterium]|nr:YihY/virulence factor BrkB family protein [Chitinophagaceae bacterium]MCB9066121.1 YihY/virulence factor BrkB family protein [Chitinophagales bacterium]